MRLTLLDMVQSIMSDMNSDAVNSIDDTVESAQVASIIRDTYFELCSQRDWSFLRTLSQLTGLGDTTYPTKMRLPEGCSKLIWVKYDGLDVTYLDSKEFVDMIQARDPDLSNVDANGYVTDQNPTYWTSYDDDYIWFDSINLTVDTTLQQSKTTALMVIDPSWTHTDNFIPLLPGKMFPMLLADAKSTSFVVLGREVNEKEETKARRARARFQNEAWRNEQAEWSYGSKINYGRK